MKTRVLLAHQHEIPALLDERQTMIIRPVVPQPYLANNNQHWMWDGKRCVSIWAITETPILEGCSPFGVSGDTLILKESISSEKFPDGSLRYFYVADRQGVDLTREQRACGDKRLNPIIGQVIHSIHIPQWASRLSLEVVGVKVKQLRDLTEEDAIAAGCCPIYLQTMELVKSALQTLECEWNLNYAKKGYTFALELWVWLAEVRRVEKGKEEK